VAEIAAACSREAIGLVVIGATGERDRKGLAGGRTPDRLPAELAVPILVVP
jgi:nucleotide-binding universal stress UspA family protein